MKKINFLLIIIIFAFINCNEPSEKKDNKDNKDENFFDFSEPDIVSIKPQNGKKGVDSDEKIEIKFSEKMDQKSVEQAFSLSSVTGSGNSEGIFSWKGDDTLIYSPKIGWTIGEDYRIGLSTSAKDVNRNHLIKSLISYFFVGDDHENPYVTAETQNPYAQTNPVVIRIYFSKDMDETSLMSSITLPGVDYWAELNGRVLVITSRNDLPTGNNYTLKISKDAKSTTQLHMIEDYTYDFAMNTDMILPEVLLVKHCRTKNEGNIYGIEELLKDNPNQIIINNDIVTFNNKNIENCLNLLDETETIDPNRIPKKDSIVIVFSEMMKHLITEDAVNLNPGVDHIKYWTQTLINNVLCDVLIIVPTIGYEQNREYTFYINNSAQDRAGNEMRSDSNNYYISLDSLPPKALRVVFVQDNIDDKEVDVSGEGNSNQKINVLIREKEVNGDDIKGSLMIRVYFEDSIEREFDKIIPLSFYENVQAEFDMGYKETTPMLFYRYRDTGNSCFEIEYTNLYFNEEEENNRYTFRVSGGPTGVKDEDDNYLEKEKIEISFIVRGVDQP